MRQFPFLVFLSVAVLGIMSCQQAKELHYFKSGENYYRLRIKEFSIASRARYLAGYFDEQAVEKYFSEMRQPDSANVVQWLTNDKNKAQFVMILSTNSNSVAEQIGNLANNEELLEIVARLANKDKITHTKELKAEIEELKKLGSLLESISSTYFDSISIVDAKQKIGDFLIQLRANSFNKLTLRNLNSTSIKYGLTY